MRILYSLRTRSTDLRQSIREWGIKEAIEDQVCKGVAALLRQGFHKTEVPTLFRLYTSADCVFHSAEELLEKHFNVSSSRLAELRGEYEDLRPALAARYETRQLSFPRFWAVEEGSAFVLYAATRLTRPGIVLETGVADGHSSFFILNALQRNGSNGVLHSIDVSSKVGCLLDTTDRANWHLHLLSHAALKTSLVDVLNTLPPVDILVQDSDHSYRWVQFELEKTLPKISPSGLILCDDTDATFAVIDFCQTHGFAPKLLLDKRKVLGLIGIGG
jgi:predicted O-methyltransferase YrrM